MPRRLPPLNALRAFEAAGRFESFSRAAEELAVSHSAISRHVRGLEARLNMKLFRDVSRGVQLTSEGALFLSRITPAFDLIAEATEDVAGRSGSTVTVNCEPVLALKWLVPKLGGFYKANPEIDLRLDASRHLIDIGRYEADIAIRYYQFAVPDDNSVLVSDQAVYAFAAPDLIAAPVNDPAELLKYDLLQDRGGDILREWFVAAGVDPDLVPTKQWRMRATLSLEAALAGQGVLLASADIVDRDVKAGRLVQCHSFGLKQGTYVMLFGEGALRRKSVRVFRDWLLEESAELRGTP